ncbi:DUF305 domain-containing protein [Streptomyces flaveus]|uniref:DUF305 domain-containing protein n=1 Tax=Streptomyces flaveus TaxID=66370 RepID=UPI00166FDC00|nr:DUF305 domain-containing protein [Streptomyces flaveus]
MLIRRTYRHVVTASVTVAVLTLAGCTGSDDEPKSASGKGPSVIAPGKPGEAAETLSAEDAEKRRPDDSPNSADFTYARMMIEHHTQALDMTELAPKRAESTQVKRLAERIAAAQGPEIDAMKGWQQAHGGDKKGDQAHDHEAMPGMATEAQLKKLRAAKGKAFDELFLKLMITHHDGAITMATDVLAQGNNIQIGEMADDVIAQQTTEINKMRDMP